MKIYLVGGAVRDKLLGRQVSERDWVVVGATPEELLALGYQQVGKDFPVFLHPQTREEYALARTERKTSQGYTGFDCYAGIDVTLVEDLQRRDLTINAIAEDADGELIDPYGGINDIQHKRLHHVSAAFVEDPLRVLRVARFAARYYHLGFYIAEETYQLMTQMANSGELQALVPERIWLELTKVLAASNPSIFFQVLQACHAAQIIFPEIERLFHIPCPMTTIKQQSLGHYTVDILDKISTQHVPLAVQIAILCFGFETVAAVKKFCRRLHMPTGCRELAELVQQHHRQCDQLHHQRSAEALLSLLEALDAFRREQRMKQFLSACQFIYASTTTYLPAVYLQQAYHVAQQVSVQPLLAQGFVGKALGQALRSARLAAITQSIALS